MTLIVDVEDRRGAFSLNAQFTAEAGVTALFGRSGSGKTTLMRMIAGLDRPARGHIQLDGESLLDTERGRCVPVHKRRFGYVFQEPRLFPHLSVARNLDYGAWFQRGRSGRGTRKTILDLLGIEHLLNRQPATLSGGEKQRVAIGRALLSSPRLLLMDEPLAALDEARKQEILPYIERLRDEMGIPIVYVSHSVAEVARLADRVVVVDQGRIAAIGPAADILSRAEIAVAHDRREAGALLEGVVRAYDGKQGLATVGCGSAELLVPGIDFEIGKPVRLYVPARDVMLATRPPEGISALNIVAGDIRAITRGPDGMLDVDLACGDAHLVARITALSGERLSLAPGQSVFAILKTVALQR